MRVYCVPCGAASDGEPGARVPCPACAAPFDVPLDLEGEAPRSALRRAPEPPPEVEPAPDAEPPRPMARAAPRGAKHRVGKPTNGWAVASLVFGVLCCIPGVSPVMGVVCGLVALSQLSGNPEETGHGMAGTGIVLSLITGAFEAWAVASGKW